MMSPHPGAVVEPIRMASFAAGVFAAVVAWTFLAFLDSLHHGDPNTGIIVAIAPFVTPVASLLYSLLGLPVFLMLRKMGPSHGLERLAFVMLLMTPLILAWCAAFTLWIDGLTGYSGHIDGGANVVVRIRWMIAAWREMVLMGTCGGVACWCADRAPLLWSNDTVRRRRAWITAGAIVAWLALPPLAFVLLNQYVVIYRAQATAGPRPYCLLIPSYDDHLYKTAEKHWQLSAWRMYASYMLVSGTRGGFYDTNHALLVLDDPREYRNWSYRSENFMDEPLVNSVTDHREPRRLGICQPKRDFAAGLR